KPMELRNFTPFMPLLFNSEAVDRSLFTVVVLRGTFRIVAGQALRLAPEPQPPVLADAYYGDPTITSMKTESDLAPFKPRTDVQFEEATAYAPGGAPTPAWVVRVQVGPLVKALRVTGPRQWVKGALAGWKLREPEPCTEVPIRYEQAFGGW